MVMMDRMIRRSFRFTAPVLVFACLVFLTGCPCMFKLAVTFSPIDAQNVMEGEQLTILLAASDEACAKMTYGMVNAPTGATLVNGVFQWTPLPGAANGSPYSVKFTASNGFDMAEQIVDITVTPAPGLTLKDALHSARLLAANVLGEGALLTSLIGVSITDAGLPDLAEAGDNPGWGMLFVDAAGVYGFGVTIHPNFEHSGQVVINAGAKYLLTSIYPAGGIPTHALEAYTDEHIQNWMVSALARRAELGALLETPTIDTVIYVGVDFSDGQDETLFAFYEEGDIIDNWYTPSNMMTLLSGGKIRVNIDSVTGVVEEVIILDKPEDLTLDEAIHIGTAYAIQKLGAGPLLTGIVGVSITEAGIPNVAEMADNPGWALLFVDADGTHGFGIRIHPNPANTAETIILPSEPYLLSSIYPPGTVPSQAMDEYTQAHIADWMEDALAHQATYEHLFTTDTLDSVIYVGEKVDGSGDDVILSFYNEGTIDNEWYLPTHMQSLLTGGILTVYVDPVTGQVINSVTK